MSKILRKTGRIIGAGTFAWMWAPAVVPSLIIMMTSFTRIVIVLSFLRNALGTQQSPPNQILVGLALFLTLFIMSPVIASVNTQAYQPYREGQITREQAFERGPGAHEGIYAETD